MEMENETESEAPKKSKRSKAKTQWKAHDKRTCKCAICLQHRGELRSSWYKHNRQTCACAVCKQARTKSWPKFFNQNLEEAPAEQDSARNPEIFRPGQSFTPSTHLEQERLHGNGLGSPGLGSHSFSVSWQTPDSSYENREQFKIGLPPNNYKGITLQDLNSLNYSMFSTEQSGRNCPISQLRDLEQARAPAVSETAHTYSYWQPASMGFVQGNPCPSSKSDPSPCPTSALLDSCNAYVDPYTDFQRRLEQDNAFWTVPSSPMTVRGSSSATFCEAHNVPPVSPRDSSASALSPPEREECSGPGAPEDSSSTPPLSTDRQPESVSLLPSGPCDASSCASAFPFSLGLQLTDIEPADVGELSVASDLCTTGSSPRSLQVSPNSGESLCGRDLSSSHMMDGTPGNMMLGYCSGDQENMEGKKIVRNTEVDAGLLNSATNANVPDERESFSGESGGYEPNVDAPGESLCGRDLSSSHMMDVTPGTMMLDTCIVDQENMEVNQIGHDTEEDPRLQNRATNANVPDEQESISGRSGGHEPSVDAPELGGWTSASGMDDEKMRSITGSSPQTPQVLPEDNGFQNERKLLFPHLADDWNGEIMVDCRGGDHQNMEGNETVHDTGDDARVSKRARTADFREERESCCGRPGGHERFSGRSGDELNVGVPELGGWTSASGMDEEKMRDITGSSPQSPQVLPEDTGCQSERELLFPHVENGTDGEVMVDCLGGDHQNMEGNETVHDTGDDARVSKRARTADSREERESSLCKAEGYESNVNAPGASDRSNVSGIDGGKPRGSGRKGRQLPSWSRRIHSHSTVVTYSVKRRVFRKAGRVLSSRGSLGVVGDGEVKHGRRICLCPSTKFCDKCRREAETSEKDETVQSKFLEPLGIRGQLNEGGKESAPLALQNRRPLLLAVGKGTSPSSNKECYDRKSFPLDVEWPLQRPTKVTMQVSEREHQAAQQVSSIRSHGRSCTSPVQNGVCGRGVRARRSTTAHVTVSSGISPRLGCMELVSSANNGKRIRENGIVCLESLSVPARASKRPRYDEIECASSFTWDLSALFKASKRVAVHSYQSAVKLTLDHSSWPVAIRLSKISFDTMRWERSASCSTGMLLPKLRARSDRKYARTARWLKVVYIVNFLWLIHRAIKDGMAHLFGIGTPADPLVDHEMEAACSRFPVILNPSCVSFRDSKPITYHFPVSTKRWTRKPCERNGCSPQTVFSRKSEIFRWGLRLDIEPFRASTSLCEKSTLRPGITNYRLLNSFPRPRRIRAVNVYEVLLNRYVGLFSIRLTIPQGVSEPLRGCGGLSPSKIAEASACSLFSAKRDEGVRGFTRKTEQVGDIQHTRTLDAIFSIAPAESDPGATVQVKEQYQLRIPDSTTLVREQSPEYGVDHVGTPAQTSQDRKDFKDLANGASIKQQESDLQDSTTILVGSAPKLVIRACSPGQTTRGQSSPTDRTKLTNSQPPPAKCFQDLLRSVEVKSGGHGSLRSLRSSARNSQRLNHGSHQTASEDTTSSGLDIPLDAKMVKRCYARKGHASNHGSHQIPAKDPSSSLDSPPEVKTVKKVAPPPKYNLRSCVVPKSREFTRPLSEPCSDLAKSSHRTSTPLILGTPAGRPVQSGCPWKRTVEQKAADDLVVEDGSVDDESESDSDEDCEIIQPPPTPLQLMREDFKRRLKEDLARPFSWGELAILNKEASARKPVLKLRETRRRALHVSTTAEGKSYLDGEPELARFIAHARNAREHLMHLRAFFFWIQNACTEGSFKPWAPPVENTRRQIDEDCMEVVPEGRSVRGTGVNRTREMQYAGSNAEQQSRTQSSNAHRADRWEPKTPNQEDEMNRKMPTEEHEMNRKMPTEEHEMNRKMPTEEHEMNRKMPIEGHEMNRKMPTEPPKQRALNMTLRPRSQGAAPIVKRRRVRRMATVPESAPARKPLLFEAKKELGVL